MEDSRRRSSPATDEPLLPTHNTQGYFPQSSGSEGPNDLPPSNRQSRTMASRDVPVDLEEGPQELDIVETGQQFNEKTDAIPTLSRSPMPRTPFRYNDTGNVQTKEASVEDEHRALNWIVPVQNGMPSLPEKRGTVRERLASTLKVAEEQQLKYEKRARWAGMAINGAMFAQIISNALITGLSASTSNRKAQIGVSALGAIGTIISSFLVRARGTREPERSVSHSQQLEKFIRELQAFIEDEGHSRDRKWDREIKRFRTKFDELQSAVHQSENGQPVTQNSTSAPSATQPPAGSVPPTPAPS
ncbi:hypothetical protein K439DRAFT_1381064 [Ramaria rubella]|nr:hypothetical protein K439DRAFT_1381064 [Ramaria rubella]